MTVYVATTKEHFRKVLAFLRRQPKDSFMYKCWQLDAMRSPEIRGKLKFSEFRKIDLTGRYFEAIKRERQRLEVFVCEDETGKIRLIAHIEKRAPDGAKEPLVAMRLRAFIDQADLQSGNFKYAKECILWATRRGHDEFKVSVAEYEVPDAFLPLMQGIYGDAMQIYKETEQPQQLLPELKKIYHVRIDMKKFLEANP